MHLITNDALVAILREQICRSGGPSRYAKHLGVSCAFISAVLSGSKYVSGRILKDLGYERIIGFRRIETPAQLEASVRPAPSPGHATPRRAAGATK
jgi:hypothetical protein